MSRRLIALEQALGVGRMEFRVFSTIAEADASLEPAPWAVVVRIITGVRRLSGAEAP